MNHYLYKKMNNIKINFVIYNKILFNKNVLLYNKNREYNWNNNRYMDVYNNKFINLYNI